MSASSTELSNNWFPVNEINKAQNNNLLSYIQKHKIPLEKGKDGKIFDRLFRKEQESDKMLETLGY